MWYCLYYATHVMLRIIITQKAEVVKYLKRKNPGFLPDFFLYRIAIDIEIAMMCEFSVVELAVVVC